MISCDQISKKLGNREIIKSFSYKFETNQSYSLVGANGAGKTTLLKLLGGLLNPDSGSIQRSTSMGWFAFSSISLMDRLTGSEQINIFKQSLGAGNRSVSLLSKWKQLEGFDEMLSTDLGHCSQGMKALLGLYISTLSGAETLLWDEPLATLSPRNQSILLSHWRELTGANSLIITHHGDPLSDFREVPL